MTCFSRTLVSRLCVGLFALASTFSFAQLAPQGVSVLSQIPLSTFGSSSGNDCWGYVSPSGREYAIVGLNNKVAFVEVTNPTAPVLLQTIPHTSSTWGDIKVYGHYAYAVSEASGTGIQVINMANIDNGVVTLVRTISSPGRSHNVVIDTDSGFLYTCGSRNGTGTTMCFSLANPANPVRVGANSMTTNYQHDGQAVTYTSGPLAGKQLWFGCSEGRGVDIYDFTDKNNPVLIKRVVYPDMGYCHQAWLSADRKYLYVDDEFDENELGVTTRSLIFNVEDPTKAVFVDSFTSGLNAVDHNQYVVDGFTFQANYRSGLRIFDVGLNPTAPVQVGSYDTYPEDNDAGYDGAWSNYPFLPSGRVIVSDIQGGMFLMDVTEATTRRMKPTVMAIPAGQVASGNLASLFESDDDRLRILPKQVEGDRFNIKLVSTVTAFDNSPHRIQVCVEALTNHNDALQGIELFNWVTNEFESIDTRVIGLTEVATVVTATGDLTRFVNPLTREVKAQTKWSPSRATSDRLIVSIDQVQLRITR